MLLISPPLPLSTTGELVEAPKLKREREVEVKKREYEDKCGAAYKSYTECLKVCPLPALSLCVFPGGKGGDPYA